MRVTQAMITESTLTTIRGNLVKLEDLQRQLTAGKVLTKPSDDPTAVARSLSYRASLEAGEQYLQTIDGAIAVLDTADSTLNSATSAIQRARELAISGSNDTQGQAQLQATANEINQILLEMVQLGNASLRGQRMFAGQQIDADPFVTVGGGAPTAVNYVGDSASMSREIDTGSTLAINLPGNTVFGNTFNALISLRDNLNAGNTLAVRNTDITALDGALDTVLAARAELGARYNRAAAARDREQVFQTRVQELLSNTEDADFAEAVSKFTLQETVYKASLQSTSKFLNDSLFDYLR